MVQLWMVRSNGGDLLPTFSKILFRLVGVQMLISRPQGKKCLENHYFKNILQI